MRHLIIVIVLCIGIDGANAAEFALGAAAGTPGIGVNAAVGITENVNLRGLVNFFQYDFDESEDGIDYALDLDLNSFGALLDWHPLSGSFRLSGGLFVNGNEITGVGRGQSGTTVEFGDLIFDADDLGRVDASMDFDSVAPYLGLGWGNPVGEGRWAFMVDIGVFFQGEPSVALATPEVDPSIAALVDAERARAEAELQDEVDGFDLFPYVSIGFAYKF
jgi:hypothetical protein